MWLLRKGEKDFHSGHWKETGYLVASHNGEEYADLHRKAAAMLSLVW